MMADAQNVGTRRVGDACELALALDVPTREEALARLDTLGDALTWVKVGLQLFTRYGPEFVEAVAGRGYKVFLDLKLHDIPNTVAKAIESISTLPVGLLTLHACGGTEMLRWAVEARDATCPNLCLLGVTVLTSMDGAGLAATGVEGSPAQQVERLAGLGLEAGIDGLVCSPLEIGLLRERFGKNPLLVTPGIRPAGSDRNEQKRVMTPQEAAVLGASMIVVGRPILRAADPRAAAIAIREELGAAEVGR